MQTQSRIEWIGPSSLRTPNSQYTVSTDVHRIILNVCSFLLTNENEWFKINAIKIHIYARWETLSHPLPLLLDAYIPSAVDGNAFFTLAKSCTTEHQIPFAHTWIISFFFCFGLSIWLKLKRKKKLFTITREAAAFSIWFTSFAHTIIFYSVARGIEREYE